MLRVGHDDRLQVQRLDQVRRRQHLRIGDGPAAGGKRNALILADIQVLVAAVQFRASGGDGDFLLLRFRIAAHGRAAILAQRSHRIFKGNFGLRSRNFPRAGRQVHLAGTDVHADLRGAILLDDIFFHGDQRIALHRVGGSVGESDARDAFRVGLDQVAFIERELVIGVHPLHRIDFLHLHFAVEIDEARLPREGCGHAAVGQPFRAARNLLQHGVRKIREKRGRRR